MSAPTAFVGSVPENYHRYLGPMLFEPYARDLAGRVPIRAGGAGGPGARLLELACGTGIVTRAIASGLPGDATFVATDLNEAMLDVARRYVGPDTRVAFQPADAQALPFADRSFDVLLCQFGVMFFPDKVRAMREARRVLAPGGRFVFNVWASMDQNPMSRTVHEAMARLFPSNPPDFLKTPFGWFDRAEIERVLRAGGFGEVTANTVTFPSIAPTADDAAHGFVEGSPMAGQLKERGVTDFTPIRRAIADALGERHGRAPCQAPMQALVFTAQ